jgi:hypothetical protein
VTSTRSAGRFLERAPDIGFERDHFELKLGAALAILEVFRKFARCREGLSPSQPARILADHDGASV